MAPLAAAEPGIALRRPGAASPRTGGEGGATESLLRFFDLQREPFADAPDEAFFYTNPAIRQVYQRLIAALDGRPGLAVLTGEAGTGKTILRRRLCDELRMSGRLVACCRAGLSFDELIAAIGSETGIEGAIEDRAGWLRRFREALERSTGGRPLVIVIDDAEGLGGDAMANLAGLLDGPAESSPRLLLCGRPELAARLDLPVFIGLKRMLSALCSLERLGDDDAASYVFHRLRRAGHRGATLFSSAAVNAVVAQTAGLPRRINRLCARALVVAAASGEPVVTSAIVEKAGEELMPRAVLPLQAGRRSAAVRRNGATVATAMTAGIIAAGLFIYPMREQAPDVTAMAATPAGADAVPRESRAGNVAPIRTRAQPAPRLEQVIQLALDEPGARLPVALPPAPPKLADADARGVTADGGPPAPANQSSGDPPGAASSGNGAEKSAVAQTSPSAFVPDGGAARAADLAGRVQVAQAEVGQFEIGQIQAALSATARKLPAASPFYALAMQAAIDAGDAAPGAATPADDTEAETAATLPAEPSLDALPGGEDSVDAKQSAPAEAGKREAMDQATPEDQAQPGQAPAGEQDSGARRSPEAPPPANDVAPAGTAAPGAPAAAPGAPAGAAAGVPDDIKANAAEAERAQAAAAPEQSAPAAESAKPDAPGDAMPQPIAAGAASPAVEEAGKPAQAEEAAKPDDPAPPEDNPPQASSQSAAAPAATPAAPPSVSATPSASPIPSASPTPPASPPSPASPMPSASPAAASQAPPAVPMPAETIAALMKRGDELIGIGDISGARLVYERAAAGGSTKAMTALGMTHDPGFLGRANARGIRPDPALAAEWYRKAAALGDAEAAARMQQLSALPR
jgi:type II secretory pathway predicted ATPase ExeA